MSEPRPLTFTRFIPPNTFGALITVARADIVAIETAWDSRASLARTLLHLRGGSTLQVAEEFRDAELQLYGCSGQAGPRS